MNMLLSLYLGSSAIKLPPVMHNMALLFDSDIDIASLKPFGNFPPQTKRSCAIFLSLPFGIGH